MKVLHSPIQFCLHFLRQSYFRLAIPCFTRGTGRTTIAVDARRWFNWHSSLLWRLMISSVELSTVAQSSFFSCGKVTVISNDLISIPQNCIFWHGSSTEFLRFIRKPRFWKKCIRVSLGSVSSSFEEAISRISSRKLISRTYNTLNR